jgi:hypothetical protein
VEIKEMMKNYFAWRAWAVIFLALLLMGAINEKTKNALKVQHLLKTIEMHPHRSDSKELTAEVTERELNDYIGYRLAHEKNPAIDHLDVHLLENNQVQGKIILDARQLNLDMFFSKKMAFDFKGILHTRRGAGRLDLDALQLNGQPVQPGTLDMVLGAVALTNGTEPSRIGDWYALPKGIDRVVVRKGKAALFY